MAETPKTDTAKPVKGKRGAPKGNRNGIRHGLTAGKLPLDCAHVEHNCGALRRQLEDAVMVARGQVTLLDAANITTAVKWERHGQLALRWLRVSGEKLKPTDQLTFSREIARASTERDKAIALLKLDRDTKDDVLDRLYMRQPAALPAPAKGIDDAS